MTIATGVGSWPGLRCLPAVEEITDILQDAHEYLPFIPELPERGPGSDMIGRSLTFAGLAATIVPTGWQHTSRFGAEQHRGISYLTEERDAAAEMFARYEGPIKVQYTGPITLAGSLELRSGASALTDASARADIAQSLSDSLATELSRLKRLLPQASWVVQIDEPLLPAAINGRVPTASGLRHLEALPADTAAELCAPVVQAITEAEAKPAVHCCAAAPPIAWFAETGFATIGLDLELLGQKEWEAMGWATASGTTFAWGIEPTVMEQARQPWEQWQSIGVRVGAAADFWVCSPCGLALATPSGSKQALRATVQQANWLTDAVHSG